MEHIFTGYESKMKSDKSHNLWIPTHGVNSVFESNIITRSMAQMETDLNESTFFDDFGCSLTKRKKHNSEQSLCAENLAQIIDIMGGNKTLHLLSKTNECSAIISKILRMEKFGKSYNLANHIGLYSGLFKSRKMIQELKSIGVDGAIAYNMRETTFLDNMKMDYVIKFKLRNNDIGILYDAESYNFAKDYLLKHLKGFVIQIYRQDIINIINNRMFPLKGEIEKFVHLKICNILLDLCNYFSKLGKLHLIKIEFLDSDNSVMDHDIDNIMIKSSMYNYVTNRLRQNILVF